MVFITRKWRQPKFIIVFFLLEFAFTIPALVLYALADPDEYRTKLWTDGSKNGFNSSPMTGLYEMANYRPYEPPLVWSSFITRYNVIISVLITFLLLVKAIMFILHIWIPVLSFLTHAACVAMFAYSARVQTMSDLSDPDHPQHGAPWYISKSCDVAFFKSNIGYCQQAKAAFAVTIILIVIFAANTIWAAYSCWPTEEEREKRRLQKEEDEEVEVLEKWAPPEDEEIEMANMWATNPKSARSMNFPLSPMTPRTFAFKKLGG